MKLAVGLLCVLGLGGFAILLGHALSPDRSVGVHEPATTSTERTAPASVAPQVLAHVETDLAAASTREPVQTETPTETEGFATHAQAPEPPPVPPELSQRLGEQHGRILVLEGQVARLKRELDECTNGPDSVFGIMRSLPEWPELDEAQRRSVLDFLQHFPVKLGVGEARLIATHTSPDGNRTAELIGFLGRRRVFEAMEPEARARLAVEDPEEYAAYFGTL